MHRLLKRSGLLVDTSVSHVMAHRDETLIRCVVVDQFKKMKKFVGFLFVV